MITAEELRKIIQHKQYDPDMIVDYVATKDLVYKILQNLKPVHREILWRCATENEEGERSGIVKQIAEERGTTQQAVTNLYRYAKQKARKLGNKFMEEGNARQ